MSQEEYYQWAIIAQFTNTGFTLLVAGIGAFIAYQQFLIARHKRRDELYERRLKIFRRTSDFLHLIRHDYNLSEKESAEFVIGIGDAEFLFEGEVIAHLQEIINIGISRVATTHGGVADEEFYALHATTKHLFRPYLRLTHQ